MKILIVDDSMVMRSMHKNLFLEHQFNADDILEAENGLDGLQVAAKYRIDLFLIDWNMPKVNGMEFLKKIRSSNTYRSTPVLMITSEASKQNVVEAQKFGVSDYIIKPIKPDSLWDKVKTFIGE
ncbi:MAG: response regulator [Spirochaetes bacterium]|nr:response regulator [Spirochaetota bacterium]